MKTAAVLLALAASVCSHLSAAALTGFPFTDEDLTYTINWPSGLGLGEAHLHAKQNAGKWDLQLNIDAGVPGFQVKDQYAATDSSSLCSVAFEQNTSHGSRKVSEKESFNGTPLNGTMVTRGGNTFAAPDCVKDALTFLYYSRRELGQGRVPGGQPIILGGLYPIQLDYAGAQTIQIGDQPTVSDKVVCSVKTAHSEIHFEAYFARDAARTPLMIKVPFAIGTFSMELIR